MIRSIAIAGVVFSMLRGPGCGDVDSPHSGANAPCTRDKDCEQGLFCTEGVCAPPPVEDSGSEGGGDLDAATSADG